MNYKESRKAMFKLGCAGAMNQFINKELGKEKPAEEIATGPLCGGLMQEGLQCGMLWGTALGIGSEAHRRYNDHGEATGQAILATRHMMQGFSEKSGTYHCSEITGCNQSRPSGVAKYLLTGGPKKCASLMAAWNAEALEACHTGLSLAPAEYLKEPRSCASETLKAMGASDEEQVMVAGYAGGMGLSGQACGALAAALWYVSLEGAREGKKLFFNPDAKRILKEFKKQSGGEVRCQKICGSKFQDVDAHSTFLDGGGCAELIAGIANN